MLQAYCIFEKGEIGGHGGDGTGGGEWKLGIAPGIICVLQTQFSSLIDFRQLLVEKNSGSESDAVVSLFTSLFIKIK